MRSVGDRAGSECLGEANAVFRQPVERRRLNVFVAVAVDVVGAEGVDGDQKNVGLGRLLCAAFAGKTCSAASKPPSRSRESFIKFSVP